MSNTIFQTKIQEIEGLFDQNKINEAYQELKKIIDYPNIFETQADMVSAIRLAAMIGGKFGDKEIFEKTLDWLNEPTAQKLFDIAIHIKNQEWYALSASIFAKFFEIRPDSTIILQELIESLMSMNAYESAVKILKENEKLIENNALLTYFFAFNAIYCGDISLGKKHLEKLINIEKPEVDTEMLIRRLKLYIERYDAVSDFEKITSENLRAWHYVLNNSILTHYSPYGWEDMHGRYAAFRDNINQIKMGLERIQETLKAMNLVPKTILYPKDFKSEVLAKSLSKLTNIPVEEFTEENKDEEGLVVTYDLNKIENEDFSRCVTLSKNQYLWSHAFKWTNAGDYNADFVTFLYQLNISPWEIGLKYNNDNTPDNTPDLPEDIDKSIQAILDANISDVEALKQDTYKEFANNLSEKRKDKVFESEFENTRSKIFGSGPVHSNRFP